MSPSGQLSFRLLESGIARRVCVTMATFLDDSNHEIWVLIRARRFADPLPR